MRVSLLLSLTLLATLSCSRSSLVPNNNGQNANTAATKSNDNPPGTTLLFTIPLGDSGVTYADEDTDELKPWGPSSFTIAPDGTFLIVDSVGNKILRFKPDGAPLPAITVEGVAGITDVTTTADSIYVLDQKAMNPALLRLTNDGKIQEKTELAERGALRSALRTDALTGIGASETGEVLLEFEGGAPRRLDNARVLDRALRGSPFSVRVPTLQNQVQEGGRAFVLKSGQVFAEIKVDNLVAELKILGVSPAGDLSVSVDEIIPTSVVTLDETVRRYRSDGTLIDIARVPLRDMYSYVENNLPLDPAGNVNAIVTRQNQVLVVRLEFKSQLEPILPRTSSDATRASPSPATTCIRTRGEMLNTAKLYFNNRTQLSLINLDGDCGGRRKPRYLGSTAGVYVSVPYDWGGYDSVSDYRNAMSAGFQAGDIETCRGGCVEDCSKGVDCSGFVSRVWGTSHEYTSTLPNISDEVNILDLLPGDVLNLPNRHVALFEKFTGEDLTGNGVSVYEATTGGFDRVIHRPTNWRHWLGYTARRFRRVCAG